MDEPLDAFLDFDEHPEVGDTRRPAAHARPGRIALRHLRPRILGELFDAE